MREALAQAHQGAGQGEVPVGAVVVHQGQIIARAHNASIGTHDPTAHAEIQALRLAAQQRGNYRLDDCTLYVTLEPCAMCSGAILQARLQRVVFGAREPRTGAAGSVLDVFATPLNHHTLVTAEVLAPQAAALMQSFFAQRRQEQAAHRWPLKDDALRVDARILDVAVDPALRHRVSLWSRYAQDWPSLNGWRVHWLDNRANATASARLYLCGPTQWSAAYAPVLAQSEPALALDWLGFGLSDQPKKESAYSAHGHAQVLADFLRRHPVHAIYAPKAVAAIWQAMPNGVWPPLTWVSPPSWPEAAAKAAYPNRGHEAGLRAWRTM